VSALKLVASDHQPLSSLDGGARWHGRAAAGGGPDSGIAPSGSCVNDHDV